MKRYVLDTDICGFMQSEHPPVLERMGALHEDDSVVTTIITFGEDLSGWLPACRRAREGGSRALAYARVQRGLDFYLRRPCLPFNHAAAAIFDQLRALKLHIGTNDLAIAAIALSVNGILVTRNVVDFERIPTLRIEDWTR